MKPRGSRSSALASKATGFPIAKIAAKLAVGMTLDEIPNDITRETPASFEPALDYVVVKIPRFTFEKFPEADTTLTVQMKSVGEVMAIGRTFKEALLKAVRSLETDHKWLTPINASIEDIRSNLYTPNADRIFYLAEALRRGMPIDEIYELTAIDHWFINNIKDIVMLEKELQGYCIKKDMGNPSGLQSVPVHLLRQAKEYGFSDATLGSLLGIDELTVRSFRKAQGIDVVYKMVDTCAAEFEAYTPYLYSTCERPFFRIGQADLSIVSSEALPSERKKIVILGSGPNRIGQGIEFDYTCVHAVFGLRALGYEAIMVNCNPETVSTDYDTSDRLYFEPLTLEDVLNIVELEKPEGVIVQFGGQTPLKLAVPLERVGVPVLGTSPDAIDRAEDRERFRQLLDRLGLRQPTSGTARSIAEAIAVANRIGYPVLVRPSYVLGGRAMEIV